MAAILFVIDCLVECVAVLLVMAFWVVLLPILMFACVWHCAREAVRR